MNTYTKAAIVAAGLVSILGLLMDARSDEKASKAGKQEHSTRPAHWSYGEADGPSKWASLDPVYSECGKGKHQSPIDIVSPSTKGHPAWQTEYGTTSLSITHNQHVKDIVDNGHTIQVNYSQGSHLSIDKKTYELKQFHFHTPSENTVNGGHYPMEMHMVHQADDGALAVYAVFFEISSHNENFDVIVENLPDRAGDAHVLDEESVDINTLLPSSRNAYHFTGSLTTPPCSENVNWLVAVEPVALSADQVAEFSRRIGNNNRPTQPLNGRIITVDQMPK